MYLIAGRGRKGTGASKSQNPHSSPAVPAAPPAPSGSPEPASLDIGGLDIGHDSDFDGTDTGFDDADLSDPELLGELEVIRREMGHCEPPSTAIATRQQRGSSKTYITAQPSQSALDVHSPVGFDHDEEDRAVESVTVTEDDMNDPVLLAELAKFSAPPETAPVEQLSNARAIAEPRRQNSSSGVTIEALKERHQEFKGLALAAKRNGDMNQAREMLVQMKSIQTAIDQAQSGMAASSEPLASEKPRAQQPAGASSEVNTQRQQAQGTGNSGPLNKSTSPATNASKKPPRSQAPSTATHIKAVSAPKKPQRADPGTLENIELQNSEFGELATSFAAMNRKLESQVSEATKLAAYFLKTGEKTLALDFHRLKKRSAADLATVVSFEANGKRLPPPFLHREVQWTMPVEQRRDISISELQVAVKRVFSDGDLASTLGGKVNFFVQWESGWPRDKNTKGYTRTIKYKEFESGDGDVDVGYTHNVEFVDRHYMRPLQRWIERGKLTVELYKYMGIIWGSQLVGRASMPLLDLRTRSEVSQLVEIKPVSDGAGRAGKPFVGGPIFVDVAARLRLPLTNKAELVEHSERWIYLDDQDIGGNKQAQMAAAPATPGQPLQEQADPDVNDDPAKKDDNLSGQEHTGVSAQRTENAPPANASETDSQSVDGISEQMDSIETTVSNAVLEMELQLIPERVRNASDPEQASVLHDLETAIKLRMSVVAAQVGAGVLTVQEYMDSVTKELQQATQWALAAKKGGRKDLALRALKRVKAMRSELEEMKTAMSAE